MKTTVSDVKESTKTYFFRVEVAQEDDGRWSAWVETLPGCATRGYTKDEALRNIRDAVEAYIRDMPSELGGLKTISNG